MELVNNAEQNEAIQSLDMLKYICGEVSTFSTCRTVKFYCLIEFLFFIPEFFLRCSNPYVVK